MLSATVNTAAEPHDHVVPGSNRPYIRPHRSEVAERGIVDLLPPPGFHLVYLVSIAPAF